MLILILEILSHGGQANPMNHQDNNPIQREDIMKKLVQKFHHTGNNCSIPFTMLKKHKRINNFFKWKTNGLGDSFSWEHACYANKKIKNPDPHPALGMSQRQRICGDTLFTIY